MSVKLGVPIVKFTRPFDYVPDDDHRMKLGKEAEGLAQKFWDDINGMARHFIKNNPNFDTDGVPLDEYSYVANHVDQPCFAIIVHAEYIKLYVYEIMIWARQSQGFTPREIEELRRRP